MLVHLFYEIFLDVDQSLYYLIESTRQRIMIIDNMDATAAEEIKNMRPLPNNMVIIGNKTDISSLLLKVNFSTGLQLETIIILF